LKRKLRVGGVICCVVLVALYVAFGRSKNKRTPPPAITPEVGVVQVQQKDVPIYSEWIGTLDGMVNAEIKAQRSAPVSLLIARWAIEEIRTRHCLARCLRRIHL